MNLQELLQGSSGARRATRSVHEEGPAHERIFRVVVFWENHGTWPRQGAEQEGSGNRGRRALRCPSAKVQGNSADSSRGTQALKCGGRRYEQSPRATPDWAAGFFQYDHRVARDSQGIGTLVRSASISWNGPNTKRGTSLFGYSQALLLSLLELSKKLISVLRTTWLAVRRLWVLRICRDLRGREDRPGSARRPWAMTSCAPGVRRS